VRHPARLGIPAAWRSGVSAARGAWICVLDGDLQYEPEQIRRLWDARDEANADIVQGARAMAERRWDVRLLLSRGLSALLNVAFGMSLRDNKSGFFLCQRQVLDRLLAFDGRYRHWQCFVMVAAHHHGYRIHQLETPFHPRLRGRSAFGRFGLGPALGVATDLFTAAREYRGVSRS
jgi:phenylacetate-CoA ligase